MKIDNRKKWAKRLNQVLKKGRTLTSTIVMNFNARVEIRTTEEITAYDQSGPGTGPTARKACMYAYGECRPTHEHTL